MARIVDKSETAHEFSTGSHFGVSNMSDSSCAMNYNDFELIDFPPTGVTLPPYAVYVICFIAKGTETPFYVGETGRLSERLNDDYRLAKFTASTDFRVGESIKFLRGHSDRIIVRYKQSAAVKKERTKEEHTVIRDLQGLGTRLLNSFPGYDYRSADEAEERSALRRFCKTLIP